MRLYRLIRREYCGFPSIVSGFKSDEADNRWNPKGIKAVYTALAPQTCYSEMGWHRVISNIDELNEKISASRGRLPPGTFSEVYEVRLCLGVLHCLIPKHELVDVSNPSALSAAAASYGVTLSYLDSRKSIIVNQTRELGRRIKEAGKKGLITRSARNRGCCVVIFPDNINISKELALKAHYDVLLTCLSTAYPGKYSLRKDGIIGTTAVFAERQRLVGAKKQITIPVLQL